MYNPKEATEDRHALNLAILFFVGLACLASVYLHHDSGLKYWLLTYFGEETPGTILNIQDAGNERLTLQQALHKAPRETLKNSTHWYTHGVLTVEIRQSQNGFQVLSFKVPQEWLSALQSRETSITYLPANPKVAHPSDLLESFSFDARVLFWSLVIGSAVLAFAARSAKNWSNFRNRMRHY